MPPPVHLNKVRTAGTVKGIVHTSTKQPAHNQPVRRDDSFNADKTAAPTAALRPASAAVTFIKKFEQSLELGTPAKEQRLKFMSHSYLSFFRANPALFQLDMKQAYGSPLLGKPAPKIVIAGDVHLGNFGTMRGPDGTPVWTLNDFDQAHKGSPETDLTRLAASVVLAARALGLGAAEQRELAEKIGTSYAKALDDGGAAFLEKGDTKGAVKELLRTSNAATRSELLARWTDGDGKFKVDPELQRLSAPKAAELSAAIAEYGKSLGPTVSIERPIRVLDVVRRHNAGGSSLGLDRYYVLVAGKDDKQPRILELKEFPATAQGKLDAKEVVSSSQQLTGFKSPLLGAAELDGKSMLVRELEPQKQRLAIEDMRKGDLEGIVELAAQVLARAHGRGHLRELRAWIGGDAGVLAERLGDQAVRYANQVQTDFAAYAHP